MVTWPKPWARPQTQANMHISGYLKEKQQIGFINNYKLFSQKESGVKYCIHTFYTTQQYFNAILSSAIAWMCFDLKVLPQIESPSLLSVPTKYSMEVYFSIKFHPYHTKVPPILEEHVPIIKKHLEAIYNVVWKPPGLEG